MVGKRGATDDGGKVYGLAGRRRGMKVISLWGSLPSPFFGGELWPHFSERCDLRATD